MKKITIFLLFILINNAFSQNGKVYLKEKFKVGTANSYVYEPPKGLIIQDKTTANLIYASGDDLLSDTAPVIKNGNKYEFAFKATDSARAFFVIFSDVEKITDNNSNKGYVVLLKTQNAIELGKTLASEISMRSYGYYAFKLKLDIKPETTVKSYEKLFAKYPNLKKDKCYLNYLYERDILNKTNSKKDFFAFAEMCLKKNTEEYLMLSYSIYLRNNKIKEKEKLEKEILAKYPNGRLAKTKYIENFFAQNNITEDSLLEAINTCKTKYNDSSKRTLITFYHSLMLLYLDNKDLEKAQKIESHFYSPGGLYNEIAWNLSGRDISSPGKDIDFAAKVSKRSLDILEEKKKENFDPQYQSLFNMYGDTYALLLYKQGKYEEAFKYQDSIKVKDGLDIGGKERYLAMLEKVKSQDEVKAYIEDEINNKGVTSPIFLSKLKEIYMAKNLSLTEYEKLKQKTDLLAKTNRDKKIIEKFGSANAPNFTLKDLQGKETKLSDYKGKVVVLDFWATWCGPCVASFPKMQELVSKYKDKDVAFLFVNTWEKGEENEILERVTNFISEKKYSFNVVFDSQKEVYKDYKINGIPTRIVINKDGSILSSDNSDEDIAAILEEHLK